MDIALLMDIDGTLTPPRAQLLPEMGEALKNLRIPFHVAAGSDIALVEPQFLQPLWNYGLRKDFECFVSNGSSHLHCPFSQRYEIQRVHAFDFRAHLGPEHYAHLINALEGVLTSPDFSMPDTIKIVGDRIMDRGSMLNFSTFGRPKGEVTPEGFRNREAFAHFDKSTGYRRRILAFLNEKLAATIREKNLRIMLGGETSFDIVIIGNDKTKPVYKLLEMGYKKIVFLGDALFDGGNDSVVADLIKNWNKATPCPVTATQVTSWKHTIEIFREHGWLG